jgi:hypothetical protein
LRGREKREFFNGISLWIILGAGLGGVGIGYDWFGAFGAILGFGVGVMLGGWVCESERFYRP